MKLENQFAATQDLIRPLAPDRFVRASDPQTAAGRLAQDGFVVVENFLGRTAALAIAAGLSAQLPDVRRLATSETDTYIVNCKLERLKNYPELVASSKPVFNVRNSWGEPAPDAGFVDLVHPARLYPELQPTVDQLASGFPALLLRQWAGIQYRPEASHLYINFGLPQPRDFHIDSDVPHVKAFLYLTDVLKMDDGPYCYVPGSHAERLIKSVNRRYNAINNRPVTDMTLVDPADAVAFLAPAGTLILTMQCGIHRGFPQAEGSRRLALIELFTPDRNIL